MLAVIIFMICTTSELLHRGVAPHRLLHGELRPARAPHQHHLAVRVRDAQRVRREDHARQTCVAMPPPLESAYFLLALSKAVKHRGHV